MSAAENKLSIRYGIDTNFIGDPSAASEALRELASDDWIQLWRADAVETELQKKDPGGRERLMAEAEPVPEMLGVWVCGYSRAGHMVSGSDADSVAWDAFWGILSPNKNRETTRRNNVFDAMHVWTAIRYGCDGFVTCDGGILKRAVAVADAYGGFAVRAPEKALAHVERCRVRYEARLGQRAARLAR